MIEEQNIDGFKSYVVKDKDSSITLVPERGGIMSSFIIKGKDLMYFKNDLFKQKGDYEIRAGGNPVLFPICGTISNNEYSVMDKKYSLKSHGFAWLRKWQVKLPYDKNDSKITLIFKSDDETLEVYPFDYEIQYTYELSDNALMIDMCFINNDNKVMPFYAGFHPFFKVTEKQNLKFDINADSYTDYEDKVRNFDGIIDFNKHIDNVYKLNKPTQGKYIHTMIDPGLNRKLIIETPKDFEYVVVWTMEDRDFVCVEPWMAPPDAMNSGYSLKKINPGEKYNTYIKIKAE